MARPPKLKPNELKNNINDYFNKLENKEGKINPPTFFDLAEYLNISYSTYQRYRKKSGYEHHIKRAEQKIKAWWIKQLALPGRPTTGVIFWLKNQAGWSDKQEISVNKQEQLPGETNLDQLPKDKLDKLSAAFEALEDKENAIDVTPED